MSRPTSRPARTYHFAGGIPFVSDAELEEGLEEAGVDPVVADAVLESNEEARIDALRVSLGILALFAVLALFTDRAGCRARLPVRPRSMRRK